MYKQCDRCNKWFPCTVEYFYINKSNHTDGLHPTCKQCEKDRAMIWKKTHPIALKKSVKKYNAKVKYQTREFVKRRRLEGYQKEWQKEHPDKVHDYNKNRQHKNHNITKQEWNDCKKYFDNRCAYCGILNEDHIKQTGQQLHKEHVIFNGANDLSNCVPACRSCNCSKWEFEMEEWYKQQPFFSQERLDKIHKWLNEDYKLYFKERKSKNI